MHHLGITVNTAAGVFEVPREKLRKIRRLAVDLRVTAKKNHRLVLKRELAKFCGFAQSVKLLFVCLLALIQTRAFSGVTTKRQSPDSLLSHAK